MNRKNDGISAAVVPKLPARSEKKNNNTGYGRAVIRLKTRNILNLAKNSRDSADLILTVIVLLLLNKILFRKLLIYICIRAFSSLPKTGNSINSKYCFLNRTLLFSGDFRFFRHPISLSDLQVSSRKVPERFAEGSSSKSFSFSSDSPVHLRVILFREKGFGKLRCPFPGAPLPSPLPPGRDFKAGEY